MWIGNGSGADQVWIRCGSGVADTRSPVTRTCATGRDARRVNNPVRGVFAIGRRGAGQSCVSANRRPPERFLVRQRRLPSRVQRLALFPVPVLVLRQSMA